MIPIYISVHPLDNDNVIRMAYFEDRQYAINAASRWCRDLNKKYPTAALELCTKPCGITRPELHKTLSGWVARKQLPQDLVVPFITETGHELDLLVPTQTTPEGWMLTNKARSTYRDPKDLPPDFLADCLWCNDTPEGCPLDELAKSVTKLPPRL